jgi:hypothetical protein
MRAVGNTGSSAALSKCRLRCWWLSNYSPLAEILDGDEACLWEVAYEMDAEDGLIWAHGTGDDSLMAFTDLGIDTLTGPIEIYKRHTRPAWHR